MSNSPYIGLRSFSREDKALFFGREQHTEELLQRLSSQHFLAVVGDSGCGKSSLIKAGLIPGLQTGYLFEAGSHWRIAETRPGNAPFAELAKALAKDAALGQTYQAVLADPELLSRSPFSLHELLALQPPANNAKLLIVCDQFEELFRYAKEPEQREQAAAFVALLLASANPYPLADGTLSESIYVILTMRSDYLGDCARFAGLSEAINQGLYLTPRLNRQQLRDAIEKPALVCNGKVEPALLVKLLAETGNDADQLPLLQHLLMRLWDNAKAKSGKFEAEAAEQRLDISLADYQDEKIQDLKTALSIHADEAYDELSYTQKKVAKQIFSRLTSSESGKSDIRNPTQLRDLMALTGLEVEQIAAVLQVFWQPGRCFLMISASPRALTGKTSAPNGVELTPDTIIDITHESLIRNWTRLERWTQKEADSAAIYRRLVQSALLHNKKGKTNFYLAPEYENVLAWQETYHPTKNWAKRYGDHFDLAMAFLAASIQEEKDELEKQERLARQRETEHKLRLAAGSFVLLALGLLAWAMYDHHNAQNTEHQRVVELFQSRLTHASLLVKGEDYVQAKNVLAETEKLDGQVPSSLRHARNLLHSFTQIKGGRGAEQVYQGAGYALYTIAISPDGQLLAAGGEHGTLVVFDAHSGKLLQRLLGHTTEGAELDTALKDIAFTPNGQQLISAGDDKKIIIWQRQTSGSTTPNKAAGIQALPTWPNQSESLKPKESSATTIFSLQQQLNATNKVNAISISPDGRLLASGGEDNTIVLWELSSGKQLNTLTGHTAGISPKGLVFSPNGRYLASGSADNSAIIWRLDTSKPEHQLTGHTAQINNLSFSADSATLATGSADKTLRLWDVTSGKPQQQINGHTNGIWAVSWFGDYLLSGSDDRSLRLWDSRSGVNLRVWQGHESGVTALALQSGQAWSASSDGTVRHWELTLPFQQAVALPSDPSSSAILPTLHNVAVGFANGALVLYDAQTSKPVWQKQAVHNNRITRLAVNHDGSLLASSSFDNTAKVWQVQTNATNLSLQESQIFKGHRDAIHALAFSPDGRALATAGYDGQIGLFFIDQAKSSYFIEKAHEGSVMSVEFNSTGKQLVSSGYEDRSLKLWDLAVQTPVSHPPLLAKDSLMWANISPDEQRLVSVGRGSLINVYDKLNTQPLYHLTGHENTILRAIFAPDGGQLATLSSDTTVKFWNLDQSKELFSLALPANSSASSSFWDFDFRCLQDQCLVAVPLVRGTLQLYRLGYEQKLSEDSAEQKRQQLELWRQYQSTADKQLRTNALQAAEQTLRETGQIAERFNKQFPNAPEFVGLTTLSDCQQQQLQRLQKPDSPELSAICEISLNHAATAG